MSGNRLRYVTTAAPRERSDATFSLPYVCYVCYLGELFSSCFRADRGQNHAFASLHPVRRSCQALGGGELEGVNRANDLTGATTGGRGGGHIHLLLPLAI